MEIIRFRHVPPDESKLLWRGRQVELPDPAAVTTLALVGCATKPGQIWQYTPVPPIDARRDLGLESYDVLAYFTDHQPIKASDAYTSQWQGVTWQFASAHHAPAYVPKPAAQ